MQQLGVCILTLPMRSSLPLSLVYAHRLGQERCSWRNLFIVALGHHYLMFNAVPILGNDFNASIGRSPRNRRVHEWIIGYLTIELVGLEYGKNVGRANVRWMEHWVHLILLATLRAQVVKALVDQTLPIGSNHCCGHSLICNDCFRLVSINLVWSWSIGSHTLTKTWCTPRLLFNGRNFIHNQFSHCFCKEVLPQHFVVELRDCRSNTFRSIAMLIQAGICQQKNIES